MRLDRTLLPSLSRLAVAAIVVSLAGGCRKTDRPADTTTAADTTAAGQHEGAAGDTTTAGILREARTTYEYGPERPPISIQDTAFPGTVVSDPGTVPRMTIATAKLKPGAQPPAYPVLARIRSSGDYPPMGIHAGDNFIWRSSSDTTMAANWATKLVAGRDSATSYSLHRDTRSIEYTHGDPKEPRLVRITVHSMAIGVCLSDPVCSSGHCGYW